MRSKQRRFQLIDALVMLAATSIGIALVRLYDREEGYYFFSPEPVVTSPLLAGPKHVPLTTRFFWGACVVAPSVVMWTLATIVLGFRQPRHRLRRLFRQPGMAGCTAALLVPSVFLMTNLVSMLQVGGEFEGTDVGYWFPQAIREAYVVVGCSVAAVWLNLILTVKWIPEPNWIDRLGRILAVYWITVGLLSLFN